MRKLLVIALFTNAFLLAGHLIQGHLRWAHGRQATENGDVNGDGARDLSDAVALLDWLFQGGPEPVAFAQTGGLTPEQEEILSHMSIVELPIFDDQPDLVARTIRFTGVNVQIVNGKGQTRAKDGLGNLIVGYNERGATEGERRTGSHNLVLGTRNSYSGHGGFVGGSFNTISGPFSTVVGGRHNTASGIYTAILGGGGSTDDDGNIAFADFSTIAGGRRNTAGDPEANDPAIGLASSIAGGLDNATLGSDSSIAGGFRNVAEGATSTIAGGRDNSALGNYATVAGGDQNLAEGARSSVGGGFQNTTRASWSTVAGGVTGSTRARYGVRSGRFVTTEEVAVLLGANGNTQRVEAQCPEGWSAIAGGWKAVLPGTDDEVNWVEPYFEIPADDRWIVGLQNVGPVPTKAVVYAVCECEDDCIPDE